MTRFPHGAAAAALLATASLLSGGPALAAGEDSGGHGHGAAIGAPGDAAAVDRTVEIAMHDNYYEPERLAVAANETVRFLVRNEGALVHEFSLGTPVTDRLILTPAAEVDFAFGDDEEVGVGAGPATTELGLRLSYDLLYRDVAPYVGVHWEKAHGETAALAREEGDSTGSLFAVAGVRLRF